jgi:hypothetical protein
MPEEIVTETARVERSELASQLLQEFLLVHAVLEGFMAVNEDDGDFVVELAAEFGVSVNVDVLPGESSSP